MRVKNITTGIRGFHDAKHGLISLEPGQQVDDAEMTAGELKSAQSTGYFEIDGKATEAAAAADDQDAGDDLDTTLDGLEAIAKREGVDLSAVQGTGANGRVLKADVQGAIRAAREGKAAPAAGAGGGADLDAMDDATLRATVQAITGTEPAADATREQLLAAARGEQ